MRSFCHSVLNPDQKAHFKPDQFVGGEMKTLPNIEVNGQCIDISTMRDVEITDLLGRKEIEMNQVTCFLH